MDRNSPEFKAFLRVHEGLPRQGPGSIATTLRALSLIPPLPVPARIFDLGCGPGRASLVLARSLGQKIVAVDLGKDFLDQLQKAAEREGLGALIERRCGDMIKLDEAEQSINLIWAEGSIFCVGFDQGLKVWHGLLAKDGLVACTELSWLTDSPSLEPKEFWQSAYPAARSVKENIMAAESLGYSCINHFLLPENCWIDEYYGPMQKNIERLRPEAAGDNLLAQAIANSSAEIELFRRFSAEYGYVFYLLQKSADKVALTGKQDSATAGGAS